MRHQYMLGLVLALALAHVEGLPVKNLYKRNERQLTIYDHDGHPKTYHISPKVTGGMTQAIYTITGDKTHLAKGPVTLLEAKITRWYTPETVIGSESQEMAKSDDGTDKPIEPGQRKLDTTYKDRIDKAAINIHGASQIKAQKAHTPLKGKLTDVDGKKVPEWWMIMPIVGSPIRDLPKIKAALEAKGKPNEKELIAACETFVKGHVVKAVHTALGEWYDTLHKASGHWFSFGDIKPSHFRWLDADSDAPKAKMIDFGIAQIDPGNARPTKEFEKINERNWLEFCTPGFVHQSNTPSVKTASQKDSQKSGHSGHGVPETSAAGAQTHPHQGADTSNPTPDTGARQPTPPGPMRVERPNSGRNSNDGGSSSSGCTCKDIMKCICPR
ncbi:hypothetical protein FRB91_001529 [Serendipita sp. 411]|nr:hypothetical protein FRC19_004802 [Serendipita sp. 401]KAG8831730.1 hypothetical protein FRC18_006109 [Serendipita sp. 400]KAG8845742.1 hypothetical protein FRB91_001529 [Serendipita sp. 411]KAG9033069.1 hypothetical protein FS842_004001 [Serendipita sp. 407]